jgi:hypothetical protein
MLARYGPPGGSSRVVGFAVSFLRSGIDARAPSRLSAREVLDRTGRGRDSDGARDSQLYWLQRVG